MSLGSDVLSENPKFVNFGLSPVNTTYKLRSVILPTTRVGRPKNGSKWLQSVHDIEEATSDRVIEKKASNHYNLKSDFETMREIQDCERKNISMSPPTFDSTPIGKNTTNRKISPIESIPVEKTLEPTPLTLPTKLPEKNGKAFLPGDLDPDPLLSDSSSKKNKHYNTTKLRKHKEILFVRPIIKWRFWFVLW